PRFTENWTLRKELLLFVVILLQVGLIDFLIRDLIYNNPANWSWCYLKEEVFNTLMGGLLLITPVISINLNIQLLKNQEAAEQINRHIGTETKPVANGQISIKTPLLSENFELDLSKLLF